MSADQAFGFFREVYSDRPLQGKLNHALAAALPELVAKIAQSLGYDVTIEDISEIVGDDETARNLRGNHDAVAEYVLPRDFWYQFRRSSVWKALETLKPDVTFDPFREAAPFRMTIPGPTWVQVMGGEGESTTTKLFPSAVELFDKL